MSFKHALKELAAAMDMRLAHPLQICRGKETLLLHSGRQLTRISPTSGYTLQFIDSALKLNGVALCYVDGLPKEPEIGERLLGLDRLIQAQLSELD